MPDASLSAALKEAYAVAPKNVIVYHTLEIHHSTFSTPIRVVRDFADLTATLEASAPVDPGVSVTFVGFAFDLVKPEVSAQGLPQLTIELDNVDRQILAAIEQAMTTTDKITVIYREYISSDLSGPQNDPPMELTISAITVDVLRIRATAGFGDWINRKFPSAEYTPETFPGLIAS